MVPSGKVVPIFMLNRVVLGVLWGSYCLIVTVLNRVVKKVNRAQSCIQLGDTAKFLTINAT